MKMTSFDLWFARIMEKSHKDHLTPAIIEVAKINEFHTYVKTPLGWFHFTYCRVRWKVKSIRMEAQQRCEAAIHILIHGKIPKSWQ